MPIAAENVSFAYMPDTPFAVQALDDISLQVQDGEFVGIIGQTGCGKSTLIQQLAGLGKPDSGRVLLDGQDINAGGYDRKELRRKVGVVFQYPEYQLFEETVGKDVAFGPEKAGMTPVEVERNVDNALRLVGFQPEEIRDASPFELSGGQKRRVAIAGVLATDPKVLILDEPIAGLDPVSRENFMQLIRNLNEAGITIIMISHNMDGLAEYASRIIAIDKGRIVRDGTPTEVFSDIEGLEAIGLDSSEARRTGHLLTERGFYVPPEIITNEALIRYLAGKLGKGDAAC